MGRAVFAVLAACTLFTSDAAGQTPVITIEQARQMLKSHANGEKLGNIDLTAVDYFREVELGRGIRAVVVSTNYGGGIAIFSAKNVMEDSISTGKIESIQTFDLDGSGVSQILTDEVAGGGTGILLKNFNLYAFGGGGIKRIWENLSYKREGEESPSPLTPRGTVHEVENFVRFDEAGAGYPARMTYLVSKAIAGQYRETVSVMLTGSTLHELSKSGVK